MIKRRFYKLEHSARDGSSSSSSSESDDEVEEEKEDVSQGEEDVLEDKDAPVDEWRKRFSVTEDASSGRLLLFLVYFVKTSPLFPRKVIISKCFGHLVFEISSRFRSVRASASCFV